MWKHIQDMREVIGGVTINEIEGDPLSDYIIDFMKNRKSESPYMDFKLTISIKKDSNFPNVAKDIFAFGNYGGGWILIGWKEVKKNQYAPVGVPDDYEIDQAVLQEKFNSYVDEPIELLYKEIKDVIGGKERRFGIIFIPPSHKILTPNKDGKYRIGDKEKIVFSKDEKFYRRGTQNVHPSEQELEIIKKRIEKEDYRISVLSGEPDEIDEEIYGNLFELNKIPNYVYIGNIKPYDDASIKSLLKEKGVFPEFYYKFNIWNGKIITFENLYDEKNPYSYLVKGDSITRESVDFWLNDSDKSRIIMELLNRELKHHAISKGLSYNRHTDKLFYSSSTDRRTEDWKGRYRKSTKTVAAKMYAYQLKKEVYCHTAFYASFIRLGNNIFLEITPTFILTEDGKHPIYGFNEGTILTRLSYNRYNNIYLSNVLFWVHQLGEGKKIAIMDYIEIDPKPITANLPVGILFDMPSSEFKSKIEESEAYIFDEGDENEI